MGSPDKIYVTPVGTWDTKHIPDLQDNIYIHKDALLDFLKKKVNEIEIAMETGADDPVLWGERNAFKQVIDKLNSM